MRGGYPSQTLPIAGGRPPTPPGSVSPLHHDQRPALDPLKHRADTRKTSPQTSPPRRRPRPTRHPTTVPYTKPHVPGQICRRKLQAQNDGRGYTESTRPTSTPANPRRPSEARSSHAPGRAGPPLTVRECQHQPHQHMSRCRQAFAGHQLGRLHGSFLTRSAPQPTTARRPRRPRKPDRPSTARSSHAPGRSYPSSGTTKTPLMLSLSRRRRAQIHTQTRSDTKPP